MSDVIDFVKLRESKSRNDIVMASKSIIANEIMPALGKLCSNNLRTLGLISYNLDGLVQCLKSIDQDGDLRYAQCVLHLLITLNEMQIKLHVSTLEAIKEIDKEHLTQ